MIRRIETLGDKLLGRLLPKVNAAAVTCSPRLCSNIPCSRQWCCTNGYCTPCRLC